MKISSGLNISELWGKSACKASTGPMPGPGRQGQGQATSNSHRQGLRRSCEKPRILPRVHLCGPPGWGKPKKLPTFWYVSDYFILFSQGFPSNGRSSGGYRQMARPSHAASMKGTLRRLQAVCGARISGSEERLVARPSFQARLSQPEVSGDSLFYLWPSGRDSLAMTGIDLPILKSSKQDHVACGWTAPPQ